MSQPTLVSLAVQDGVGVITVNNPPVNALSAGVPEGIATCLATALADPAVQAIVLIGAGRSFIAGADIREFDKGRVTMPIGDGFIDKLDASPKPVIAAIHGYALGGGLETALGCNYRIALRSAKLGLPEVLIGLLPGAGGTQRLPRLIGPKAALDLITTGRHVPADEAKALGIVDEVVEADLLPAAIAFAHRVAAHRPLPQISANASKLAADPGLFDATRKAIARKARNQKAPYNCIAAVEAACTLPFAQGLAREAELFRELETSAESRALRYVFFAEREAAHVTGIPPNTKAPAVQSAAVVGAGTMGGGIAMCFADAAIPVKILEASQEALDRGMARIRANYETSVKRGSLAQDEMERRFARITPVLDYAALADADVAIEAIFEEMAPKQAVFRQLDAVMKPGALLLSNTSALNIDEIASVTQRPDVVAGAHFFSPANVMKLLEVVKGAATSAAADPNYRKQPISDRLCELGRFGQKTGAGWYRYEKGDRTPHPDPEVTAIIEQVSAEMGITRRAISDEEILHRLLFASINEACKILEEGIAYRASDVDVMWLHGFGFPRYRGGLMFWADQIGVKTVYEQIQRWHQLYGSRWAPSALLRQLAETGTAFKDAKAG